MSFPFSTKKSSNSTWKRYISLELVVNFYFLRLIRTKSTEFVGTDAVTWTRVTRFLLVPVAAISGKVFRHTKKYRKS